jgi:hypothetical protein
MALIFYLLNLYLTGFYGVCTEYQKYLKRSGLAPEFPLEIRHNLAE